MKSTKFNMFLAATATAVALSACGGGTSGSDSEPEMTDKQIASLAWEVGLNDDERKAVCFASMVMTKEEIIEEFTTGPDATPKAVAEEFYKLIEEDC